MQRTAPLTRETLGPGRGRGRLSAKSTAREPAPFDATIDGEAPGIGNCSMGQGNAVNDCQFDIFRPVIRQRSTSKCAEFAHRLSSESLWEGDVGGYHKSF